jgi:16S rRNA (uracil1498-N3)-methyltransferase
MTKHRFFVLPEHIKENQVAFSADLQAQIGRVLRLKAGDEVEVLDNQGKVYQVCLSQNPDKNWFGSITSSGIVNSDPRIKLTLFFGLTQRDKVEWILQKGTEIGISAFQPFISWRTLAQQPDSANKHHARWGAILREAAEQSGRGRIPDLFSPVKFKDALKSSAASCGLVIAAWEDETLQDLKAALGSRHPASIEVYCGPEGGFDPAEIDLMRTAGVQFFSLGKRILRMETAAILAPALVLYELGEMSVLE